MFNHFLFRKSCLLRDNVEKSGRARQATDDHMHVIPRGTCHLITKVTDTLTLCNT